MIHIVSRNFLRLLRAGAFNDYEPLEPMSAFKWDVLARMAEQQSLVHFFAQAVNAFQYESSAQLPSVTAQHFRVFSNMAATANEEPAAHAARMHNYFLNRRLKKIHYNERHAIDTSVETLALLDLIVRNIHAALTCETFLSQSIALGTYLRTKGHQVDFVKLETWLRKLGANRIAQLMGSILVVALGFAQDELPFVHRVDRVAHKLLRRTLDADNSTPVSHTQRPVQRIFMHHGPANFRRILHHSLPLFKYAPAEVAGCMLYAVKKLLTDIEE